MINMSQSGYEMFNPQAMGQKYMAGSQRVGSSRRRRPWDTPQQGLTQETPQQQPVGENVINQNTTPQYQDYNSVMGQQPAAQVGTGVQNPPQWGNAEQLYQNAATNPWFGQAAQGYGQMAQNGMPVDMMAAHQAARGVAQQDVTDLVKQAAEEVGSGSLGKRYGTTMGRTAQDIGARAGLQLGSQFAQMDAASRENALGRMMGAYGGLGNTASAYGQNQMNAGQGYQSLGNDQNAYRMNLANQAYNMGQGLYGVQQNQANDLSNYWAGNQPWSNPWMQYGMNLSQYSPEYMYPQYKQSTMGGLLNIFSSLFG